jgi:cytochrome c-type biogenesis protein CcmF
MNIFGQCCLLIALVGSGFSAFTCLVRGGNQRDRLATLGRAAGILSVLALSIVSFLLAWALVVQDFRFAYAAQYSSRLLPWYFRFSGFWVGQAGSLLLWAWFSGIIALVYCFWPRRESNPLRTPVFGVLMIGLCFLIAIMVFGADPMEANIGGAIGAGLSPSLQHPAMLIHPPIVFLGYAGWSVPFALAVVSLAMGGGQTKELREARGWALFAWGILGAGVLIGADWAYEELGWGGYWSWDPVENGSLVPWLVGTAFLHALLAWQNRGVLKKTAVLLAVASFALCNLASFITRSGIFSSLHAFSQSPLGWMFLAWMVLLGLAGVVLVLWRRHDLAPQHPLGSVWAREGLILISILALLLLATVALVGSVSGPVSLLVCGRSMVPGAAFYNNVLIPTGLVLLAILAATPLLRWGRGPTQQQRGLLSLGAGLAASTAAVAFALGVRHPVALAVAALAAMSLVSLGESLFLDTLLRTAVPGKGWALWRALREKRRQYAGFLIHMGIVCVAVGITGSSLGTQRLQTEMQRGETLQWAGRSIRFVAVHPCNQPDKLIMEAELEISSPREATYTLRPAQYFHRHTQQWSTAVAIHSTWTADFYTILHNGENDERIGLTLVENPLMRWLWFGGAVALLGLILCLWPAARRTAAQATIPLPISASSHQYLRAA